MQEQKSEGWYKRQIPYMLEDFYKDVRREKLYEREDTISMKEFYQFLENWIDKHFSDGEEEIKK